MTAPTLTHVASRMTAALERAWYAIQSRHPDVPDVHITVAAGSVPFGVVLGHFAPHRWHADKEDAGVHELFVGGEGLQRGAVDVLGTLLHEAAHGVANTRGVQDCSRQGRYHNKRFKVIAEELGLELQHSESLGYSNTLVPLSTQQSYADLLMELDGELSVWRSHDFGFDLSGIGGTTGGGDKVKTPKTPTAPNPNPQPKSVISCYCVGPAERRIRAAHDTLLRGPITCGVCGGEFTRKLIHA